MTPQEKYPALMAYIENRSAGNPKSDVWCGQLRLDEQEAYKGGLSDVVEDLQHAQVDYKAEQAAKGHDGFPYNRAMGIFLGLPIRSNNEPPVGYYMASCAMHHFRLGKAEREIRFILDSGRSVLRVVAARDKTTGMPVRFHTFQPSQVRLEGGNVICSNGRTRVSLSSNWSIETTYEKVAEALRNGCHYGHDPVTDAPPPATKPANTNPAKNCASGLF